MKLYFCFVSVQKLFIQRQFSLLIYNITIRFGCKIRNVTKIYMKIAQFQKQLNQVFCVCAFWECCSFATSYNEEFLPLANNLPVTAISSYCHGSETTALVPLLLHTNISQFSIEPLTGNKSKSSNDKLKSKKRSGG